MYIPQSITKLTANKPYTEENIGESGSAVMCFEDMVLKIDPSDEESDTHAEMLRWLEGKIPVSKLLAYEKENGKNYLLTSKINGKMVCDQEFIKEPEKVTRLMAEALQMLWSIDISDCPVDQSIEHKLRRAKHNVENDLCDIENTEPETFGEGGFKDPYDLLRWLCENKPKEEPVLSHGDFCLPNVFAENDRISGFIDLGRSGKADRYQDIALAYRSLKNNYNGTYGYKIGGYDPSLLFKYLNMEPDMEKIRYYILLDELF